MLEAILITMGIAVVLGIALLMSVYRRLKRISVPADAGFFETLRRVPFSLVVALDLLDLGLDVLAAPFTWLILDRLGLKALRQVATIEALIPFTSPIPTLTLCWIVARRFEQGGEIRERRRIEPSGPVSP
jgi:hypothetical protein